VIEFAQPAVAVAEMRGGACCSCDPTRDLRSRQPREPDAGYRDGPAVVTRPVTANQTEGATRSLHYDGGLSGDTMPSSDGRPILHVNRDAWERTAHLSGSLVNWEECRGEFLRKERQLRGAPLPDGE
jgi:hypothetical protein